MNHTAQLTLLLQHVSGPRSCSGPGRCAVCSSGVTVVEKGGRPHRKDGVMGVQGSV